MNRIIPGLALFGAVACAPGQPGPAKLPPPCAPEVAARVAADTAGIQRPMAERLSIPPDGPRHVTAGPYHIELTVGVDGRVLPGTVRVTGPDHPGYAERLARWAAGCASGPPRSRGAPSSGRRRST